MTAVTQGRPAGLGDAWPVIPTEAPIATYSAAVIGLVPGTAATDVLSLDGSATKVIKLTRIEVSGISTAGGVLDIQLVKRSANDTVGTPTTLTAVPHNVASPAASGVVKTWTGTPPTTGALVGAIRANKLTLAPAASTAPTQVLVWEFGMRNGQAPVLTAAAQTLALNLNGATIQAGNALDVSIEWTEA